jgi:hypothetical protein
MQELIRDLCRFATGVVADDNAPLFARIARELPLEMFRFKSGETYNGWQVPQNWRVKRTKLALEARRILSGGSLLETVHRGTFVGRVVVRAGIQLDREFLRLSQ